jgi:hypothetical protein
VGSGYRGFGRERVDREVSIEDHVGQGLSGKSIEDCVGQGRGSKGQG